MPNSKKRALVATAVGFVTMNTLAPLEKLVNPEAKLMNCDVPSKDTVGCPLTAFDTSTGWLPEVAWLALLFTPDMSCHAVTLVPLVVTPLSAFNQSCIVLLVTSLVNGSI